MKENDIIIIWSLHFEIFYICKMYYIYIYKIIIIWCFKRILFKRVAEIKQSCSSIGVYRGVSKVRFKVLEKSNLRKGKR